VQGLMDGRGQRLEGIELHEVTVASMSCSVDPGIIHCRRLARSGAIVERAR
jgi:hypothetical protein